MKKNNSNHMIVKLPMRIAQATIIIILSAIAFVAYSDYLGTLTNRIFLDPDSLPAVADGYQVGDVISYIAESTPDPAGSTVGAGAWNTIYVPPGVEVVGAEIVGPDGDGTYSAISAPAVAPLKDGCGNRGCAFPTAGNIQNGKLNEGQQDAGIFFSTNSRTQLLSSPLAVKPTGSGDQEAWNAWDAEQVRAFGGEATLLDLTKDGAVSDNGGQGNTPVVDTTLSGGGGGAVWAGTGSPVAGPQTYYTNDYNPVCSGGTSPSYPGALEDIDLLCEGPWERIAYTGSSIGGSGAVMPTILDPGPLPNSNTSVATSLGHNISEFNPLPSDTNAIRYVLGKRIIGQLETVRITFKITDAAAFTSSLMDDTFCIDATGGDTDKDGIFGRGGQDTIWRYYEGSNHSCFEGTVDANALKSIITVDGVASSGSADASSIIGYELQFTNTGSMTLYDINFTDTVSTPNDLDLIPAGTSALCPYPSYNGDYAGSTPTLNTLSADSATWNELPTLGPGETVKVHLCAEVDQGANFGDTIINKMDVTYAITDGGMPEPITVSVSQIVISTIISGTVYLEKDTPFGTSTGDDTGISGVSVQLYLDENGDGVLDSGDALLDTAITNIAGQYSFVGQNDGDDYLVVETGLSHLMNTADTDTPVGTCAAGTLADTCDVVAFNLNGSSINNNFYNVGATIGDFIWLDLNGDGVQDGGAEVGIDGVTVDLYEDNGTTLGVLDASDTLIDTTTTSGGGAYDFDALGTGNYIVDVTDTAGVITGLTNTTTNDPLAVSITTAGQDFNNADFGYILQADLFITKTDDVGATTVDTYTPGAATTYIITVGNNGGGDVTGATVSDTFPLGATLSGPVTCVATGTASCTASIGTSGDLSFSDTAVDIAADVDGVDNVNGAGDSYVTYTVPISYSTNMADYTP